MLHSNPLCLPSVELFPEQGFSCFVHRSILSPGEERCSGELINGFRSLWRLYFFIRGIERFHLPGLAVRFEAVKRGPGPRERSISRKELSQVTFIWAERSLEGSSPRSLPRPQARPGVRGSPPAPVGGIWSGGAARGGGARTDGISGTPWREASGRDLPMASRTPRRAAGAEGPGAHPRAGVPTVAADKLSGRPASVPPFLPARP